MDFVHDQLATGRKIRVLTIVDTFSRFSPAIDPRFSYRGEDVVQVLWMRQRNPMLVKTSWRRQTAATLTSGAFNS